MTSARKPMVCIVDDDEAVRHSLVALVQCSGYSAVSYSCAEQFLESDPLPEVEFFIVDVRLPGMSGIELLDQLATLGLAKPAVVITGHADSQDVRQFLKLADVCVLPKPCAPEQLLDVIAAAVNQQA
jgi:FixJ family two-component response regulator